MITKIMKQAHVLERTIQTALTYLNSIENAYTGATGISWRGGYTGTIWSRYKGCFSVLYGDVGLQ